jgi:hypothetical protein
MNQAGILESKRMMGSDTRLILRGRIRSKFRQSLLTSPVHRCINKGRSDTGTPQLRYNIPTFKITHPVYFSLVR